VFIKGPLQGSSVAVGFTLGSLNFAALVLNLWAGRLGDRHGRRLIVTSGAAIVAASSAALLLVTSLPALVLLRLIAGAGEALFFVGAASAVNDVAPEERRGEAVSMFSLALHAGIAIGPALGEWVLARSRFDAVWLVAAGCAALAALLGTRLPARSAVLTPAGASAHLIHPAAILPGLLMAAGGVGLAGFNAFVPLYALQLGLPGSRYVFVTFSGGMILVRTLGRRIPDRLGPLAAARNALIGTAVGLMVITLWQAPAGLFAGTVIFALAHALLYPAMLILCVRAAPPHQRASAVGTMTSLLDLAFWMGPTGLGVVANVAGYGSTFAAAALVAAAGLMLLRRAQAVPAGSLS
jgi:MFS family permease